LLNDKMAEILFKTFWITASCDICCAKNISVFTVVQLVTYCLMPDFPKPKSELYAPENVLDKEVKVTQSILIQRCVWQKLCVWLTKSDLWYGFELPQLQVKQAFQHLFPVFIL
jgi:hypothetical protein